MSFYGHDFSWRELDELSDRVAGWLEQHGVDAGDRVGVFLPNSPQFPTEGERFLCRHDDVAVAAVVPRADEPKGQVPVAFVLPRDGAELAASLAT